MRKPIFVLDYDGVILDSLCEKFVVGFNGYLSVAGGSTCLDGRPLGFADYQARIDEEPHLFEAFRRLVPLIRDLGENAAVFRLIEQGEIPLNRNRYQDRLRKLGPHFLERCSGEVLRLRRVYSEAKDYDSICPGFPMVVDAIKKHSDEIDFCVCTTKPLENVCHFNSRLDLTQHIARIDVCTGTMKKVEILHSLTQELSCTCGQIAFVDDFAHHLLPARDAGFSCYFATWGFGGGDDRESALSADIPAISQTRFAAILDEVAQVGPVPV